MLLTLMPTWALWRSHFLFIEFDLLWCGSIENCLNYNSTLVMCILYYVLYAIAWIPWNWRVWQWILCSPNGKQQSCRCCFGIEICHSSDRAKISTILDKSQKKKVPLLLRQPYLLSTFERSKTPILHLWESSTKQYSENIASIIQEENKRRRKLDWKHGVRMKGSVTFMCFCSTLSTLFSNNINFSDTKKNIHFDWICLCLGIANEFLLSITYGALCSYGLSMWKYGP